MTLVFKLSCSSNNFSLSANASFVVGWVLLSSFPSIQALLERGFASLMDSQRLPELKLMYQLFQRVHALEEVTIVMMMVSRR